MRPLMPTGQETYVECVMYYLRNPGLNKQGLRATRQPCKSKLSVFLGWKCAMLGFIRSSPAASKLAKAPHLQAAATLAITKEDTMLYSNATTPSTLQLPYKQCPGL